MSSPRVRSSAATLMSTSSRSTCARVGEVDDLDDADELVELLLDLLEHLVVAARHQRDARDGGIERLGDRQALDVEAAAAEQPGDARQHAELVLDQDGDGVRMRGLDAAARVRLGAR